MSDPSGGRGVGLITPVPFGLAYGGRERLAARTLDALRAAGIDARPVDPWAGDLGVGVLHLFGAEAALWDTGQVAHRRGVPLVVSAVMSIRPMSSLARRWKHVDRLVPMKTSYRFRRELLGVADVVVAATGTEAGLLESFYGVPPSRVVLIPNGVDDEYFAHNPGALEPGRVPERFLLSVGVISALKGQLAVLEAGEMAGFPVVFVGEMRDPLDPHNAAFLRAIDAGRATWLHGLSTSELAAAYARADAFVLASRSEGMPLSALEAQAAGTRLVLTDLDQHREVFGDAAQYCRWGDAASIASAIRKALDRPVVAGPPVAWRWTAVAQALGEVYRSLAR